MEASALKDKIMGFVPEALPVENKQYPTFIIPVAKMHDLAITLKNDPDLAFDYLFCQSGVDMVKTLQVVYHLESTRHQHQLVLKVETTDRENPQFDTVCDVWMTAEFHEREIFDLFGIRFANHPDLRRLFLDEEWKGFPLRKDYVDEVNIVEL